MDVCSAFLHEEVKESVFMYLPKNCNLPDRKVCKLKKAIYGLKMLLNVGMINSWSQNFVRSENDHCLYFEISALSRMYVSIYVDDLITGSNIQQINDEKFQNERLRLYFLLFRYISLSKCK